jgi:universal stress protein A
MNRWDVRTLDVRSPVDGTDAEVQVDACTGVDPETISDLTVPAPSQRASTSPPLEARPVVLVPLDGRRGSEAVLPTAAMMARERGARIRLLRVVPSGEPVGAMNDRITVYADQESARVVHEARGYLRGPRRTLANYDVEEIVRFGTPTEEILREAQARDVVAIAMAAHRPTWFRRLLRLSVSQRVERRAWVPVVLAPYGTAA